MLRLPASAACLLPALSVFVGGCQTYSAQLQRGQGYYEQNQYEHALALWRHLEADQDSLDERERTRYCYLRGMTDYRLEYRSDARYWLRLSLAAARHSPGALGAEETKRLEQTLEDLNADLYGTPGKSTQSQEEVVPCQWSTECSAGFMCQEGACVSVE